MWDLFAHFIIKIILFEIFASEVIWNGAYGEIRHCVYNVLQQNTALCEACGLSLGCTLCSSFFLNKGAVHLGTVSKTLTSF